MIDLGRTISHLTKIISDIDEHAESRVKYDDAPYIIDLVLPCICSYLSYWWSTTSSLMPNDSSRSNVTATHMNSVLGSVLKLIHNNMDAAEAPWMKCIAGRMPTEWSHRRRVRHRSLASVHASDYLQFIDQSARAVLSARLATASVDMRGSVRAGARLASGNALGLVGTRGSRNRPDEGKSSQWHTTLPLLTRVSHAELRDARARYLRLWSAADQIRRYPSLLLAEAWRYSRRAAISQHGRSVLHVVPIESQSCEVNSRWHAILSSTSNARSSISSLSTVSTIRAC